MFCVECSKQVDTCLGKKILCKFCGMKYDKYNQTNDTYKFIDCLLLKEPVFRHYTLNKPANFERLFFLISIQIGVLFSIQLSNLKISTMLIRGIEYDMMFDRILTQTISQLIYILILHLLLRNIGFLKIAYCILFSSFFNLFKVLFVLWQYRDVQYYMIIETLNCCSNICALKSFSNNHPKICFVVIVSKGFAFFITVLFSSNKSFY